MDFKKHALILAVIEKLCEHGSKPGKTHVQKALFFLSTIVHKPDEVPFHFVLYKHGPYTFDLDPELGEMKSYAAISSRPVYDYGVVLSSGEMASFIKEKENISPEIMESIDRVCEFIGSRKILELERIATAAWIRSREEVRDGTKVAERLHELKPHISTAEAEQANEKLKELDPKKFS